MYTLYFKGLQISTFVLCIILLSRLYIIKRIIKTMENKQYEDIPSWFTHPNIEELNLIFSRKKYNDEYLESLRCKLRIIFSLEVVAFIAVIVLMFINISVIP